MKKIKIIVLSSLLLSIFQLLLNNILTQDVQAKTLSVNGVYWLRGIQPASNEVLHNPYVDGIALRSKWNQVEPREGIYNWADLDKEVFDAVANGKKVSLQVTPGIWTPDWVYTAGAKAFWFKWDKKYWGQPVGTDIRIPIPWDNVYLDKWLQFIRALGEHYASNPNIVLIKMTGVNCSTEETYLPSSINEALTDIKGNFVCMSNNDVANWQKAGYTRLKVEKAWRAITDTFAQAFTNQSLAIQIVESFPPIDDNGILIPHRKKDWQITNDFIHQGLQTYGNRFIVMNDSLSAFWIKKSVVALAKQGVTTAYQMAWFVTGDRTYRMNHGKSDNPHIILQKAIDKGITAGAEYLEIYPVDITNPEFKDIIMYVHEKLSLQ